MLRFSSQGKNQKYSRNVLAHDLTDLHIHIGGAMSPHTLWEIAHSQGIKLPVKNYWDFCTFLRKIDSMEDLHNVYEWTERIQSSPKAIERGIYNVISKEYRSSNVSKIELRFNPMFRTRGGEIDMDHIIHAAIRGMERATLDYKVETGLIFCLDRRLRFELNEVIVKKAILYRKRGVIGLDIAGPEDFYFKRERDFDSYKKHFKENVGVELTDPAHLNFETGEYFEKYTALFRKAREKGLGITVHTGETKNSTVKGMINVIESIKPDRIGHGIRAAESPEAMALLKKYGIVLEICPTMNLTTGSVKSWQEMKKILQTFWKAGVTFTINTDGPYLAQTGLAREFRVLLKEKVLTLPQLKQCLKNAEKATFINRK